MANSGPDIQLDQLSRMENGHAGASDRTAAQTPEANAGNNQLPNGGAALPNGNDVSACR